MLLHQRRVEEEDKELIYDIDLEENDLFKNKQLKLEVNLKL